MRILGIDSSGLVASVAIWEDDVIIGEYTTNFKKTHSQTLLPMLDELKHMIELDMETIDAIAVAGGPGSFTGLRIGSATAKGLGLALNVPIISVPTVEALAYNLWGAAADVCPLMDARRNQTYTGVYRFENGEMKTITPQCAVDVGEILDAINQEGRSVIFLGDGVPVFAEQIKEQCRVPYTFAPAHMNRQNAAALCARAREYFLAERIETAAAHRPDYLRLSQAERERLERQEGQA
ncbi:MAG: tRNA (adenosine(37)-N6)-threonylcarbamoyltransferase complex dimerization subunit type 1 TsaB [Lachnospiraceae bacterium]|nr:tRNA (adenosine(37)-N6)-threonylcarbamoyltransferase complex dimerization subunit type 1 TsaB [Lachnospiraceae bacterium]